MESQLRLLQKHTWGKGGGGGEEEEVVGGVGGRREVLLLLTLLLLCSKRQCVGSGCLSYPMSLWEGRRWVRPSRRVRTWSWVV